MIFAGLWFGTNKPQMLTFFSPFYEGLSKLETEGVNINIPVKQPVPLTQRLLSFAERVTCQPNV